MLLRDPLIDIQAAAAPANADAKGENLTASATRQSREGKEGAHSASL